MTETVNELPPEDLWIRDGSSTGPPSMPSIDPDLDLENLPLFWLLSFVTTIFYDI